MFFRCCSLFIVLLPLAAPTSSSVGRCLLRLLLRLVYICFIVLSWLTGPLIRSWYACLLHLLHLLALPFCFGLIHRPARLFVITKARSRRCLGAGKRLKNRRVGVLWCSLKFVALISIVRPRCCCCCYCFWHYCRRV